MKIEIRPLPHATSSTVNIVVLRALVRAVADMQQALEEAACTCPSAEEHNRHHAPSRRRRDSRCAGVRAAVKHRRIAEGGRRLMKALERRNRRDA